MGTRPCRLPCRLCGNFEGSPPDRAPSSSSVSGLGPSGQPFAGGFLAAAEDAIDSLPAADPVILLGESIGTGVASAMAARFPERISGLLLLTPFDSLLSVAQHHYPLLPVRWILRDKYPSADWLKAYTGPIAFILAADDSIVPATLGRKLHDGYAGPKQLHLATGDHNDLLHGLSPPDWKASLGFLLR